MENCVHNETVEGQLSSSYIGISRKYLLRQILVSSGVWTLYIMPGIYLGVAPVFVSQTRRDANSTAAVSPEMASWLSSATCYSGILWVIIIPVFVHYFGRKIPFYVLTLNSVVSYVILYRGTTVVHVLIGQVMAGIAFASHNTLAVLILIEYTSPQYRGVFLTLKSATMYWGIWMSNAVGTFFHWRNVGIIGLAFSVFSISSLFWPESPYWLASKGKFGECSAAHHWLKGSGKDAEKELEMLIESQKNVIKKRTQSIKSRPRFSLIPWITIIRTKHFYKPMLVTFLLISLYYFSGKMVCSLYILQMVNDVTKSHSTAFLTMLVLDAVTVVGMYVGCALSRYLKRRTQLFASALLGILFLYAVSLYLFLISRNILSNNKIALIFLLTGFSIFISIGPMLMITTITSELIPIRFVHLSSLAGGLFDMILSSILLKFSPNLFQIFGLHGTFLFYALTSSVLFMIAFKYLPETKDKTLQEIGELFNGDNTWTTEELDD